MNLFTKQTTLMLVSLSLLVACKGKNGNSVVNDSGAADKGSSAAAVSGNGNWSVNIDGQAITGKGTNELQLVNTAFIYPAGDKTDKYLLFDLMSDKNGADYYYFRFYTPDKEGQFAVEDAKKNGYRCSIRLDLELKSADNFAVYSGDSVAVTINSINSTGISGTFSGEFKLSDLSRSKPYKNRINITDGKFDIPFSTGNMRPE